MANDRTLTAANAIITLTVQGLYDSPRRIQGFSADDITDLETLQTGETQMGVDGRLSAGFVFNALPQNITLQADSESIDFFENWQQAQAQRREMYIAGGAVLLRATGKRYTMTRGFLTSAVLMPALRKIIQPRRYTITWESVTSAPA